MPPRDRLDQPENPEQRDEGREEAGSPGPDDGHPGCAWGGREQELRAAGFRRLGQAEGSGEARGERASRPGTPHTSAQDTHLTRTGVEMGTASSASADVNSAAPGGQK